MTFEIGGGVVAFVVEGGGLVDSWGELGWIGYFGCWISCCCRLIGCGVGYKRVTGWPDGFDEDAGGEGAWLGAWHEVLQDDSGWVEVGV